MTTRNVNILSSKPQTTKTAETAIIADRRDLELHLGGRVLITSWDIAT